MMTPRLSKLALTTHITCSVGWLGGVAGFLALSIAGLTSRNAEVVRGAYLSMNLIGLYAIVPLSLAALATGLVQSLGTEWGLLRHYWILVKLTLTIGATGLLMHHQFGAVEMAARRASALPRGTLPEIGGLGTELAGTAGFAAVTLLAITAISVFKPWGLTPYGHRERRERRKSAGLMTDSSIRIANTHESVETAGEASILVHQTVPDLEHETAGSVPLGLKVFAAAGAILILLFGVLHHLPGGHAGSHAH